MDDRDWHEISLPPTAPAQAPARRLLTPRVRGVLLGVAVVVGVVVLVGVAGAGLVFAHDYHEASVPAPNASAIEPPTVLLDASGEEIRRLDLGVVGTEVAVEELPDHVVDAVLAAEDDGFYGHGGFSVASTIRATLANLTSAGIEEGASTITQQYVDLTTPGTGRNYRAKLREVATAVRIDRSLTKDQILTRYLNLVPFGRDASGIDAAAKTYFGVPAGELDVNQAATLAGMIAAPSAFDPERHPRAARTRRDIVLRAMGEEGWLSGARVDEAAGAPLPEVTGPPDVDHGPAAYFVDAVRRRLERQLPEDRNLSRGLVVHTTMDSRLQQLAQETIRDGVADEEYTGALVSVDPATGEVRALVGGPSFEDQRFNAAVQAERQAGSAFKPFTLTGFVAEGYDPGESWYEAPAELEVETDAGTTTVENYSGHGYGQLTVRRATVLSVNTVYMQLVEDVGPRQVAETARRMGVRSELPPVPSITLGTGTVTPRSMASAFATFAAEGVARGPVLIRSVTRPDGEVVHETEAEEGRAIEARTAGVVTDVLADVVDEGTGTAAQLGRPVAGKTGTTDDGRDAWFVGFAPQLATSVWVGTLDNAPMPGATGGGLAAPIWADYMGAALEPLDVAELPTADAEGLEGRNETDEPTDPAPEPTTTSPSPSPTSPSPSPSETGTASPSPSPTQTEDETQSESPSPTETTTGSPAPTETSSETETEDETRTGSSSPSETTAS